MTMNSKEWSSFSTKQEKIPFSFASQSAWFPFEPVFAVKYSKFEQGVLYYLLISKTTTNGKKLKEIKDQDNQVGFSLHLLPYKKACQDFLYIIL